MRNSQPEVCGGCQENTAPRTTAVYSAGRQRGTTALAGCPYLWEDSSENIRLNTVAYALIVALLWVMVWKRFLFRIIPT